MSIAWQARLKTEFEFRKARTFATIHETASGGPARRIITGREPHPTGRDVCIMAGFRGMPWESMQSEFPLNRLAEVASPIRSMRAQPHKLEMKVSGGTAPTLSYFPDFELEVEARLLSALAEGKQGKPFWKAALEWKPASTPSEWRLLIVETKSDHDLRAKDPDYLDKLDLARQAYSALGWSFAHLVASKDLPSGRVARGVEKVFSRAQTRVTILDIDRVSHALAQADGRLSYEDAATVLGAGPLGRAKLHALHVRRIVSIDLAAGLLPTSAVALIADNGAPA